MAVTDGWVSGDVFVGRSGPALELFEEVERLLVDGLGCAVSSNFRSLSAISAFAGVFGVFLILLTRFGTIFKTIKDGYFLVSSQVATIAIRDKGIRTKPLAHGIPRRSTG